MSDFRTLMQQGHDLYMAAAIARGNVIVWQSNLYQAIGYVSEALLVANENAEHARAYSQLAEIHQELGDLDSAEKYLRYIFEYVPDDIIAYSHLLQIACLRYKSLTIAPSELSLSKRGETGAALKREGRKTLQGHRIDQNAKVLIEKAYSQMSMGQLNAAVYIGVLKQTIEFAVPYLIACSKFETVRELYLLVIVGPWHNYFLTDAVAFDLTTLQVTARRGMSSL